MKKQTQVQNDRERDAKANVERAKRAVQEADRSYNRAHMSMQVCVHVNGWRVLQIYRMHFCQDAKQRLAQDQQKKFDENEKRMQVLREVGPSRYSDGIADHRWGIGRN